ncbi:hypothetical protein SAMN02745244_00137 [Tessaracoccus bendigoensis DSM 12906]|uniref:SnoaL-like domain-containing protein n=1 Tax=Tessaracoccus bendigoensis DSM 12906 TaxID=1123357 RepID=A0A1M6ABN7_9ACTN|nr:hypothetical protein [Tessaracoccus bendigoensis]SHI33875.1 hypothetical protein SAMN02745244_00137 [Tessaracoccus bendigoensis DSM 12906]
MRLLIAALVCVAVLVGCGPTGAQTPSPSPSPSPSAPSVTPTPTPSPSPTPTPTPTAFASFPADLPTEDPETAAVIEGWQAYWKVYEKFAADPASFKDFTETQYVTTGKQSVGILDELEQIREAGLRSDGGRQFRDIDVVINDGSPRTAVVSYCMVLDSLRVVDAETGERVVRTGSVLEQDTLEEMPDGSWRVALVRNKAAVC